MEPRSGRIVNGAIVLDEGDDLEEGASVIVWIGDSSEPVDVTDEELELIAKGRDATRRGELLEARAFLAALRADG